MKIWITNDFIFEVIRDFLFCNLGKVNTVGSKGKLLLEISNSQIRGYYETEDSKLKLKPINFSQNDILKRVNKAKYSQGN